MTSFLFIYASHGKYSSTVYAFGITLLFSALTYFRAYFNSHWCDFGYLHLPQSTIDSYTFLLAKTERFSQDKRHGFKPLYANETNKSGYRCANVGMETYIGSERSDQSLSEED